MDSICLIAISFLIYGPVRLIGVPCFGLHPKKAAAAAADYRIFGFSSGPPSFANMWF